MDTELPSPSPPPSPSTSSWLDLALYLLVGFGGFILATTVLGLLVTKTTILTSLMLYLLNITFFAGSIFLVGVLRGRLSLAELGIYPLRFPWQWIVGGAAIALALIPARVLLALLVQVIASGGLDSLAQTPRMDILTPPEGSLGVNFLVTFLLGGILVPASEELFFRGALYTWFRRRYPVWVAVLVSSLLFALGHLDLAAVVATSFVIGVVNALLFERTRTIWVPIVVHVVNNSAAILLLYALLALQRLFPGLVP